MKLSRSLTTLLFFCQVASAQTSGEMTPGTGQLQTETRALQLIRETADSICKDIPLEQTGSEVQLSGDAKAKLDSVIAKVVDLGVEGTGKYKSSRSQGVLQKDLAEALKTSTDCKLVVFNKLVARLLPSSQPDTPSAPTPLQDYQSQIRAQLPLPPVVLRSTDPDYRTTIFVLMMVLNKTAPPVSITHYELLLDTPVGKFGFSAELMPDPNTTKPAERALLDALHSVQLSNIKLTSESLIEETRHPMKLGQRAVGFLMFKTQDDIYDKLMNAKGSMTIVFVDSQDQRREEKLEYDRPIPENASLSCPVL